MRRLLIVMAMLCPSLMAQLNPPVFSYSTGVFLHADGYVNTFQSIGATPTFQKIEAIQLIPGNIADVYFSNLTPNVVCTTVDGTTPAAAMAGTCSNGTGTSCTQALSTVQCPTVTPTGNCTVKALSTAVGSTNSSVTTTTLTVTNMWPASGTYAYGVAVALSGVCGGNVIYTTDGSTPTGNGSCGATHGTAVANGSTVTMPTSGTTVLTAVSCIGGTTAALTGSPATYVTRAPITWYVDTVANGAGTRYSSNVTSGQCNGQSTAHYISGVNQNCPFQQARYLWDDDSGVVFQGAWLPAGGDTIQINGCTPLSTETNPVAGDCRIGWDNGNGGGPTNLWCTDVGNNSCYNPTITPGQEGHPTLILGKNASSLPPSGQTNPRNYATSLTQIFGGFGLGYDFNLVGTQYVTIEGFEFTEHNGVCTRIGSPAYPAGCSNSPTYSDFANAGILMNRDTQNITFQDVYIHGMTGHGMFGPFGQGIVFTRVYRGFNASTGWLMDDGGSTPDGPNASITATYDTMEGNGCLEEYPVVHGFSAISCWDDVSNGFGDAWSGQDTILGSFTCTYCNFLYNVKDATFGPHPLAQSIDIENAYAAGNGGSVLKWVTAINGTVKVQNSTINGNCSRFGDTTTPVPGGTQSFALSTGLGGAYLSDLCRAGGDTTAGNLQSGVTWNFNGNTFINDAAFSTGQGLHIFVDCGSAYNIPAGNCGSATFNITDDLFLGYTHSGTVAPGVFGTADSTIVPTFSHNDDFGNKSGTGPTCGSTGNICVSPLVVAQPAQTPLWGSNYSFLDIFNPLAGAGNSFYPSSSSPLTGAGTAVSGMTTDYYGVTRPNPPSIGAVEFTGATSSWVSRISVVW